MSERADLHLPTLWLANFSPGSAARVEHASRCRHQVDPTTGRRQPQREALIFSAPAGMRR